MSDPAQHILVVEGDPWQVQLLEEAFSEMAELRTTGAYTPLFVRDYALDAADALAALRETRFDVVLVDMQGPEGLCGIDVFSRLQTQSPDTPLVAMVPLDEEPLGVRLVRQGAQDYLIREEIDCLPLARLLRAAIERNRVWRAMQSTVFTDSLTGLYNRRGFLNAIRRDGRLAARLGLPFTLTLFDGRDNEPQARDLRLLEAAEILRRALPEEALAGRWDEDRLAVASFDGEAWCEGARISPLAGLGFKVTKIDPLAGDASVEELVEAADQVLCQNRQLESCAGRHL